MNIKFFYDETSLEDCLKTAGNAVEAARPEKCWRVVRETMEEIGYRSALTYGESGKPSMYYWMTTQGIRCCEISERNDKLEWVSISSKES